uniref:HORF n=1 Tax=Prolasmidonta heterodon TaxID=3251789 RepID=A0A343UZ86_PROHE|nr:HORF [Alasmidonta heterodon]AVK79272.1 HORF [Alasmidonta heterodon]
MMKFMLKLSLLILSIFAVVFLFSQIIQALFVSDEFWMVDQVLCSMELDNASSQPKTDDHPVIPSPAKTDLTKPNAKSQ